jgi:streptomycin 6-kinase
MLPLPESFVQTTLRTFGEPGRAWLADLPGLLAECCRRWSLRLGEPFPLSFNYVVPATTADGAAVVLKLGVPNPELASEMAALRLYDGRGAARLLDCLPERGALLLERVLPGSMLADMTVDDAEATRILAQSMRRLWRPLTPEQAHLLFEPRVENRDSRSVKAGRGPGSFCAAQTCATGFYDLRRWTIALRQPCGESNPGDKSFPHALFDHAAGLLEDLLASQGEMVLLHGDLHHDNVLQARMRSGGDEWLAIDPKGLAGEREIEVGPMMYNPWQRVLGWQDLKSVYARRLDILQEELDLDRQRMLSWCFVESLLSIVWLMEDGAPDWQRWLRVAEALEEML